MQTPIRKIWLLTFPGAQLLDLVGPWEVFGHANDALRSPAYELVLVTPSEAAVTTQHDLIVAGGVPLEKAIEAGWPHTLIVAGGSPEPELPQPEARLANWLGENRKRLRRLVSICSGAFVLGAAGTLAGRRATTHWQLLGRLQARFPSAHVVDEGIFVKDGDVWTSAGVSAGIDLALALVEEDHGHAIATTVARTMLLFLRRSGRQAQFSEALKRQEKASPANRDLHAFVAAHMDETLTVERIADFLGMSPRSATRWFRSELKESPAAFVRRLRIEEARAMLAETSLTPGNIAKKTGLGDESTMWRAFVRHVGVSPGDYRRRFQGRNPSSGADSSVHPLSASR